MEAAAGPEQRSCCIAVFGTLIGCQPCIVGGQRKPCKGLRPASAVSHQHKRSKGRANILKP